MTRLAIAACLVVGGSAHADTRTIAGEVAHMRGLSIPKPLEQEVVSPEELRTRIAKLAGDRHAEAFASARWGLVPLDADYESIALGLSTDQKTALYDTTSKKLTLTSDTDEVALLHEIEHAVQDAHFGLAKLDSEDADEALAHRALVEGDVLVTTFEVLLARKSIDPPWSNPAIVADLAHAIVLPSDDLFDAAPLALRERELFATRAGFQFVAALRAQKPWSAVDSAFKHPPRSTEQVLHPEKYLADEKPVVIDAPALDAFQTVHTTVWGELGFQLFLCAHGIDADTAKLAAAGWAGDRVATFARPDSARADRGIGIATLAWDSEVDAIEAYDSAVRAIDDSQLAAIVETTETRTRWLALDGTMSLVERTGETIVIEIGMPPIRR